MCSLFFVQRDGHGAPRTARPTGVGADSPGVGAGTRVVLPGMSGTPSPKGGCGFSGPLMSSKALAPIPSPSGGGCRPQGRQERENVAGPRCGNDRRGEATILPSASGHVLPLPSSASRRIGGCHLPPLGEGRGGCEFAGRGAWGLAAAAGRRGRRPLR